MANSGFACSAAMAFTNPNLDPNAKRRERIQARRPTGGKKQQTSSRSAHRGVTKILRKWQKTVLGGTGRTQSVPAPPEAPPFPASASLAPRTTPHRAFTSQLIYAGSIQCKKSWRNSVKKCRDPIPYSSPNPGPKKRKYSGKKAG